MRRSSHCPFKVLSIEHKAPSLARFSLRAKSFASSSLPLSSPDIFGIPHLPYLYLIFEKVWATPSRQNQEKLNEAFRTAPHVILLFSVNGASPGHNGQQYAFVYFGKKELSTLPGTLQIFEAHEATMSPRAQPPPPPPTLTWALRVGSFQAGPRI